MKTQTLEINVAPSSTEGHFIRKAKNVVVLDQINETFLIEGSSDLVTKNHTTLQRDESCLITCQTVYDPFKESFRKSHD